MPDALKETFDPAPEDTFDPAEPAEPAKPPTAEPKALPPRDETGRFTKPTDSGISASLRAQAKEVLGLDDADIDATPASTLTNLIIRAQDQMLRQAQQWRAQRVAADEHPIRTPQPEPEPEETFALSDSEDQYHPDVVRMAKELAALKKQNKELISGQKQIVEREHARQQNTVTALVDEAFEALEQETLFGTGSFLQMQETQPERARRLAVYRQAGINPDTDTPRVIARKIKDAANLLFPAKAKEPANAYETPEVVTPPLKNGKTPRPTPEEYRDATVARPTQRQETKLPPGRARAIQTVAKHLAAARATELPTEEETESVPD